MKIRNQKKILFVLDRFNLGGIQTQSINLAIYLQNHNYKVEFLSIRDSGNELCNIFLKHNIKYHNKKVFRNISNRYVTLFDYLKLIWFLRRQSYDIIIPYHRSVCEIFSAIYKYTPAKLCLYQNRGGNYPINTKLSRLRKLAINNKPIFASNSQHGKQALASYLGINNEQINVIYNGLKLAHPIKTRKEWRDQLGISQNAVIALMMANYFDYKDHQTLLKAWNIVINENKIENAYLILAGSDHDTKTKENLLSIQEMASDLNLKNTIIFLEHIKDNIGLINTSDIGILSSKSEGLSNSVLEFMGMSKPFIGSNIPGIREAVGNDYRYLFEIGDYNTLAQYLSFFINNDNSALGKKLKLRFDTNFTVEIMGKKYLDLIEKNI